MPSSIATAIHNDPEHLKHSDPPLRKAQACQLPNQLKYIIHSDHSNPVVCLQLYIKTGSVTEASRQSGYSHFLEHLCFKATKEFPANQVTSTVAHLGGSINAFTDFDATCFYLLLPSEKFENGLRILSQLALDSDFSAVELEMEKDIIIEELKQYENDPEYDFIEYIQKAYFRANPLRRPVLGTLSSIRSANYESITRFRKAHYQPGNAFLVFTGDVATEAAKKLTNKYLGNWKHGRGPRKPDLSQFLEPELPLESRAYRHHGQEFLAFVLPELAERHPDSKALLLAIRYLAVDKASRLYQRLVEESRLCSSVKVNSHSGVISGISEIIVTPFSGKALSRIETIFYEEYLLMLSGQIDPDEIETVKKDIIHAWRYDLEGVENLANVIGAEELNQGFEHLYDYDIQIKRIQIQEVIRTVRKYWEPRFLSVIHQGPKPFAMRTIPLSNPTLDEALNKLRPAPVTVSKPDTSPDLKLSISFKPIQDQYYHAELENGLKVIYRHLPHHHSCGFALSTDLSQLRERRGQRGLNIISTTAMLHSTKHHTHRQIVGLSRDRGFNIRVEHHLDSTIFRGKCFPRDLRLVLSLLKEILVEPGFEPEHLALLKLAAIDDIRREKLDPASYAYHRWIQMLFGRYNSFDRGSGDIKDIRRITHDKILAWHSEMFFSGQFSLAVVGSLDPDHLFALIAELFAGFPLTHGNTIHAPDPPNPCRIRTIRQRRGSEQGIIHLGGFGAPAKNREHTTAFHLLAQVLGGDMDSRLFNLLREKYGYAYQTGFDYSCIHELGFWTAYGFCDPDDQRKCLKLIREILADIVANGISETELRTAKNYMNGMNRFERESASFEAANLANLSSLGYEPQFYLSREQRINAISLETVRQVAQDWLSPDNQFTHILL